MNGHPHATALYGPPKLLWRSAAAPDACPKATNCEETRCGSYRLYQDGRYWVARYVPGADEYRHVGIERSRDDALAWVRKHQRKMMGAAE